MTSLYAVDAEYVNTCTVHLLNLPCLHVSVMIQNTEDADVLIAAVLNGRVPISECIRGQRVRLAESGRVLIYLGERYQDEVKWKRGLPYNLSRLVVR
jgi:glutathione S-transferase